MQYFRAAKHEILEQCINQSNIQLFEAGLTEGIVKGAANRPRVIWKSRHRDYTSTSCQNAGESARSKTKAAECDNRAALDGHVLTGSVARDEREDTHSPLLFGQKNIQIGWPVRPATAIQKAGITSQAALPFKKPAAELLQFVFRR